MSNELVDFDKLVFRPRIAQLAGQEVDVTKIPSAVALEVAQFRDKIFTLGDEKVYKNLIELTSRICMLSNKKLTPEFLISHTHHSQLMKFVSFVLAPLRERVEEETGKKK